MVPSNSKILVIDDSEDMRSLVKCLLEPEGYEIKEASNGQAALDLLSSEAPPGLILLDHMMPIMDGPDFLKKIELEFSEIFAKVPVILFTGTAAEDTPVIKAVEIVSKPVKVETLLYLVKKYLN